MPCAFCAPAAAPAAHRRPRRFLTPRKHPARSFAYLFKIPAVVLMFFYLRNDVGSALSLADEAAGAPGVAGGGGEMVYAASAGVDDMGVPQGGGGNPFPAPDSRNMYAAKGGYQSTL